MKDTHTIDGKGANQMYEPRKGRIAEMERDRMEAEQEAGERRYYASVMHDELSNDIDFDNRDEDVA